MNLRYGLANVIAKATEPVLKHVFRRPAANFPGKIALYVDPDILAHARNKASQGSVVICGTNGKTSVTNLVAGALANSEKTVICNNTGANLDSGIATSFICSRNSELAVIECDEMYLRHVLPKLQSDYLLLLNLFRDQLDRVGEIDIVQNSIVEALENSPSTTLLYNADDPMCAYIAKKAPNKSVAFGTVQDMKLPSNRVADAQMCQICNGMLGYNFLQYGQLGDFYCSDCDFKRPELDISIHDISLDADSSQMTVTFSGDGGAESIVVKCPMSGAYMVYNCAAALALTRLAGGSDEGFRSALGNFNMKNGRLEKIQVGSAQVLLNLAKNPTGFNLNLKIIARDKSAKVVGFFINDKEADGRDISWIWDVDFEEIALNLAGESSSVPIEGAVKSVGVEVESVGGHSLINDECEELIVFAGGTRRYDLALRLKYAGINARVIQDPADMISTTSQLASTHKFFAIANYTALPSVRNALIDLSSRSENG